MTLGCGSSTAVVGTVQDGEEFTLRIGESVVVAGSDLVLRLHEVEDSRCPINALVLCVHEGDAVAWVEAEPWLGEASRYGLHVNAALGPTFEAIGTWQVTLLEVAPAARLDPPLRPADYRVKLRVDSGALTGGAAP